MKRFFIFLIIPSFLILIIIFHPLIGFSDTIELITGESIDGKFIKGDNQAITITTEKGEKKIPINSISKIIFKEKPNQETIEKTLEKGTLKGVITYYFNENYGDKPDIGSEVYVMRIKKNWGKSKSNSVALIKNPEVEDFVKGLWTYSSAYNRRSLNSNAYTRGVIPGLTEELKEMGADTEEGFKHIDEKANNILNDIKIFNKIESHYAVVDGNGQFELQLPPGSYFVVVLSKHSKGHATQTEKFHNNLYLSFADIGEKEVTTMANSFSPY